MELQRPLAVVTSGVDGDVLRVLGSTHAEFSVPRLHELIPDRSIPGIRRSVERLTTQGIVERLSIGRVAAYRLNDDHLAAPAVRELADLKSAFLERLRRHVGAWPHPPVFGALFGSAARGEMRPDSDLDIILVRPDDAEDDVWARGLADLTRAASTWTGTMLASSTSPPKRSPMRRQSHCCAVCSPTASPSPTTPTGFDERSERRGAGDSEEPADEGLLAHRTCRTNAAS